jgi:hypothetical protein
MKMALLQGSLSDAFRRACNHIGNSVSGRNCLNWSVCANVAKNRTRRESLVSCQIWPAELEMLHTGLVCGQGCIQAAATYSMAETWMLTEP